MSAKRISLFFIILIGLLLTGCGTDTKSQLKPPGVYRDPQVQITHAPTEVAEIATVEADASETAQASDPLYVEPTEDEDQALMDEIENSLNDIENDLNRMNTNP